VTGDLISVLKQHFGGKGRECDLFCRCVQGYLYYL